MKIIISACLYAHLELQYNLVFLVLKASSGRTKISDDHLCLP